MFDFTAYDLRKNPTVSERIMWHYLRARRMVGLKFRRQHALGPFIADFACLSHKIVIEVDGEIHDDRKAYDERRDRWLKQQGFMVIRIKNEELDGHLKETLMKLRECLMRRLEF